MLHPTSLARSKLTTNDGEEVADDAAVVVFPSIQSMNTSRLFSVVATCGMRWPATAVAVAATTAHQRWWRREMNFPSLDLTGSECVCVCACACVVLSEFAYAVVLLAYLCCKCLQIFINTLHFLSRFYYLSFIKWQTAQLQPVCHTANMCFFCLINHYVVVASALPIFQWPKSLRILRFVRAKLMTEKMLFWHCCCSLDYYCRLVNMLLPHTATAQVQLHKYLFIYNICIH